MKTVQRASLRGIKMERIGRTDDWAKGVGSRRAEFYARWDQTAPDAMNMHECEHELDRFYADHCTPQNPCPHCLGETPDAFASAVRAYMRPVGNVTINTEVKP